MEFKDLLKKRRHELQLTLEDVGQAVGVSKATVLRWESGEIKNIRRDKIKKLADVLQTTPAYLMGWETDTSSEQHKSEDYLHTVITEMKKGGKTPIRIMGSEGNNMYIPVENKDEYELVTSILKALRKSKEKDTKDGTKED